MPIKNYTTTIDPKKSIGKIQEVLNENGADSVHISYKDQKPDKVDFVIKVDNTMVRFRLSVDVSALLMAMKNDKKIPRSLCNTVQAEKVAWKNKYEWLQIQMAEIQSGQARLDQLLLGWAVTNNGTTLYDEFRNSNFLLEEHNE